MATLIKDTKDLKLKPPFVVVPLNEWKELQEDLEISQSSRLLRSIAAGRRDIKKGRTISLEISRKDYERMVKKIKFHDELDTDLAEALTQVKRGQLIGPFKSGKELVDSLTK